MSSNEFCNCTGNDCDICFVGVVGADIDEDDFVGIGVELGDINDDGCDACDVVVDVVNNNVANKSVVSLVYKNCDGFIFI